MKITRYRRVTDTSVDDVADLTWPELVERLSQHDRRPGKDGPGWSPATFLPGTKRADENVLELHAMVFDVDKDAEGKPLSEDGAESAGRRVRALKLDAVISTTHSHSPPDKSSLRVVIRLPRPVSRADWRPLYRATAAMLGFPVETKCENESRFWYWPSAPEGSPAEAIVLSGDALDVDTLLTTAPERVDPVRLPTEALETDQPPASPALLSKVLEHLARIGPAVEGQNGDAKTYQAAAIARFAYALSEQEAFDVLAMWNRTCQPPWSSDELWKKIQNAHSYAQGNFGEARSRFEKDAAVLASLSKPKPADVDPFNVPEAEVVDPDSWEGRLVQARRDVAAALTSKDAEGGGSRSLFFRVEDLLTCDYPETVWLIESLVAEGGTTVVAGEPKTGIKSWSLVEMMTAIVTGTPAFGQYKTRGKRRGAYFFAEDLKRAVRNRFVAAFAARGLTLSDADGRLFIEPRGRFLDVLVDEDLAIIVASVRILGGVDFLVLEPLRDLHSGEENDSDGMAPVMKRLRVLGTLLKCTVAVAHHVNKSSEGGGGRAMRGSSAIHGSIDSGFYVSEPSGDGQTVFVNHVKSEVKAAKSAGMFELKLTITDDTNGEAQKIAWAVATKTDTKIEASKQLEKRVLEAASAAPYSTRGKLREVAGMNNSDFGQTVNRLLMQGKLVEQNEKISLPVLHPIDLGIESPAAT